MALESGSGAHSSSAEGAGILAKERSFDARHNRANSATSLLIELFHRSPTKSPRRPARVMLEKGVCTEKSQSNPQKKGAHNETTKAPLCEVMQVEMSDSTVGAGKKKDLRTSVGSSQASYYEGDKEFEETIAIMDEEKVEALVGPTNDVPLSSSSGSASSGSSLSRTTSNTTAATSVESLTPGNNDKRRKRDDVDEYPCRRPKAPLEQQDYDRIATKANEKGPDDRPAVLPVSVSASHQRHTKMDRPLPRNLRDPGHTAPITSTTRIAVSSISNRPAEAQESPTKKVAVLAQDVDAGTDKVVTSVEAGILKRISEPNSPVVSKAPCRAEFPGSVSPRSISTSDGRSAPSSSTTEGKFPSEAPIVIAHDQNKQLLLDIEGIAIGVQYEIARGITQGWWAWEDITEGVVKQLRGTNFEKAGKVAEVIGVGPRERLSPSVLETRQLIYAELDREQKAFVEGKNRGLGLMGPWEGTENWHGGCVQLTAKLVFDKENGGPPFSIRLNSLGSGKSNRAARRFTSLSILQLKFEREALYDEKKYRTVIELLSRHAVICGRLYQAFCTKEGKIFFVEASLYQRQKRRSIGDHLRLSFNKIMQSVNPLNLNKGQAVNKWLARWQLILSTSRPVVEFEPENIFLELDDIYGDELDKDSIMTDGCGLINLSALRLIAANTNSNFPVVVQGRIAGAKGLWLLHPSPEHRIDTEPPKIWIRRSQLKIKLPAKESWDRSLRIFDLVRLPRLTVPSGLNMQTIMCMSYNGVKDKVFVNLMDEGLKKEIDPLTKWEGDNACVLLAKAVEEAGGLMASRRTRGAGGEARLFSFVRDEADDDDDSGTSGGLVERDPISGCPASLFESAHDMLVAGFSPLQNVILRDKLKYILKEAMKAYMEKFHIPVISSAEAFIAPDPCGVLEEGEIYFRCSTPVSDPMTTIDPHTFLGPVLVSRNPTRVPSDVRKVTAVSRDQLLSYTDVIVFSTKGRRSLASYLGGGDYDGDTVTIIADPEIVEAFHNSEYIPEPREVRDAFEVEVERVSEFMQRIAHLSKKERYHRISRKILDGLSDGKVGLYSHMHDNAIYELGYNNPETIRLAYMFTTCLDSVKSGLRIKDSVFKEDSRKWNVARAECMQTLDESTRNQFRTGIGRRLHRPRNLGPFVLETLKKCAKELADQALCDFEELSDKGESSGLDEDLAKPYNEVNEMAARLRQKPDDASVLDNDLKEVRTFVESLCEEYIAEIVPHFSEKSPRKNGRNDAGSRSKTIAQIHREYARRFQEGLSDGHLILGPRVLREVKASYAHIYGASKAKMGKGFAFVVAHDVLRSLKDQEKGGAKSRECRDYMLVSSNLVKLAREEG